MRHTRTLPNATAPCTPRRRDARSMQDAGLAAFLRKTFSARSQALLCGSLKAPDGSALQGVLSKLDEEEKARKHAVCVCVCVRACVCARAHAAGDSYRHHMHSCARSRRHAPLRCAVYEAGRQGAAAQERWWAAGGHTALLLTGAKAGAVGAKRRRQRTEAADDKENQQ
jgi:hypothetical protein